MPPNHRLQRTPAPEFLLTSHGRASILVRGRGLHRLSRAPEFQAVLGEVKPRWESVLELEQGLEGMIGHE